MVAKQTSRANRSNLESSGARHINSRINWGEHMKVGARNRIVGKVTQIKKGSLMSIVHVGVSGPADMASVMTIESLKELGLKKGDKVEVIVKAVNVLLIKG